VLFVLFKNYNKIDVIHLLNTINYNSFGYYFLLKKKFIWGPIDGGTYVRFNSYHNFPFWEMLKFGMLNIFNQFNFYLNPFFRLNLLCSDWVFSSTIGFKNKLANVGRFEKVSHLPDTGSNSLKLNIYEKIRFISNDKIVYTWMGQNIPRKNLSYLLDIIKRLNPSDRYIFNIVGVELGHFQETEGVIFHGIVDFLKIEEILKQSHFLVSTSIRDSNTSSAFEAFDMLVPTICSSQIGFSDLIKIHGIGITYDFNKSDELFNIINKINLMDKDVFLNFYTGYLERIIDVSDILTYDFKSKVILGVYDR
jgi:glycosyltransferase involved in cell wall biosynthesis